MNLRVNRDGVLKLVCALLLASAIGSFATGADASGCLATRLDGGTTIIDISKGVHCDADRPNDAGRGRPGMSLLNEVA